MAQSAFIDFGNQDTLRFEEVARPLRLWRAVGGAHLNLEVRGSSGADRSPAVPYRVSALMRVGLSYPMNMWPLCQLTVDSAIQPGRDGTPCTFTGFVSDVQLRALEELRGGADDLWITLDITATRIDELPHQVRQPEPPAPQAVQPELPAPQAPQPTSHAHSARFTDRTTTLAFSITSGEWLRAWEQVDAGSFMEVLVPLPEDPEYAKAVGRVRTARKLIHGDHLEEALGEVRKAVEAVRTAYKTASLAAVANNKPRKERDKNERWALLVEDLFGLVSGAAHDDPNLSEHFEWTRAEVVALVATTAGLLARLASDR
jgi:hypothetical protein